MHIGTEEDTVGEMNFILDPSSSAIANVRIAESHEGKVARYSTPLFSDDPDKTGRVLPDLPGEVHSSRFLVEVNDFWRLDGHRWLIDDSSKNVFTDQRANKSKIAQYFSTDRDTSLSIDDGNRLHFNPASKKIVEIQDYVGLAVSAEPSNWGSFLMRVVPKLAWLKQRGIQKVLMYRQLPQQLHFASIIGFKDEAIIHHHPQLNYKFIRGAILPSQCHVDGFIDSFSRNFFLGLSSKYEGKSNFGRKIYIARNSGVAESRRRRCLNENEVCDALRGLGFDIVVPDSLSVEQQIATFANADIVVGPSGAGLFNSVFCSPGTYVIDIESERHWIYAHCNLFSSLGLNYGIFWARPQPENKEGEVHLPFTVNVPALIKRVQSLI